LIADDNRSIAHLAPMPVSTLTRQDFLRGAASALAGGVAFVGPAQAQPTERKMLTRPIPSSGKPLPVIGLGTWRGFDVSSSPQQRAPLADVLRVLFEAGGSVVDSSPMYGPAESVTGDLLAAAGSRDKAFIATKVWTQGKSAGIAQMQRSMKLLRTDHVDLMQIHNLLDWRTHLATLRDWKEQGRISYVGVTHYTSSAYAELEAVLRAEKLDFVQLNYAIDDRTAEKRLLPLAAERGVAVIVNLPFGGGGLLRRLRGVPLPAWAAEIGCETWAQALLKFVVGHPAVTCTIPGTSKPEHMRENAHAGIGPLPDAALRQRMIASIRG
jgi:diketogulonate reductase-like aldo/keto reductase